MSWWARLLKVGIAADSLGSRGERAAAKFLTAQRMRVLARNIRYEHGEIDIALLARCAGRRVLVLAEVKTRTAPGTLDVVNTVAGPKRRRLIAAAKTFIATEAPPHDDVRFDIVLVTPAGNKQFAIEHHPDAFGFAG